MLLPPAWLPGLPLTGNELVRVRQGSGWVYPKLSDIIALAAGQPTAELTADEASISDLQQRVSALETANKSLTATLATATAAATALTSRVAALESGSMASVAQIAAANALIVALTQRVAALEGKPDPCVALSGSLPIATLQIGTLDVSVPVPGLLSTDRIAVEVLADLPAGLVLGAARPSPTAAGVLLVQTIASVLLTGKPALPLAITALR